MQASDRIIWDDEIHLKVVVSEDESGDHGIVNVETVSATSWSINQKSL